MRTLRLGDVALVVMQLDVVPNTIAPFPALTTPPVATSRLTTVAFTNRMRALFSVSGSVPDPPVPATPSPRTLSLEQAARVADAATSAAARRVRACMCPSFEGTRKAAHDAAALPPRRGKSLARHWRPRPDGVSEGELRPLPFRPRDVGSVSSSASVAPTRSSCHD